jgi:FkbM family methyltransferase
MLREILKKYVTNYIVLHLLNLIRKQYVYCRTWLLRRFYPDGKYVSCNKANIFVDFNDKNHLWYYGKNNFLSNEIAAFITLLDKKQPNVIVDIGAHWGVFPALLDAAISAGKKFDINRIVCVEPDMSNLRNLQATLAKIKNFKVDITPVAISDTNELISIYKGGGTCAQTYKREFSEQVGQVRGLPLQAILKDLSIKDEHVTHIKLDIDGYEPAFFYGATDFLVRNKPLLLIEFWANGIKAAGFNLKEYWDYLWSMYHIKEVDYPGDGNFFLSEESLKHLEAKDGVTNLLLLPR